jgi:hypothetical protein
VDQCFGYQNQYSSGLPDREQALHDQARLDGFPQPDFVGQQHARDLARRDFVEDVELMRDQVQPPAQVAADLGLAPACLRLKRAPSQVEDLTGIHLSGHQALGWQADRGGVGDLVLTETQLAAEVHNQPVVLFDPFDGKRLTLPGVHRVTDAKLDPLQNLGATGIEAAFAGSGEMDANAPRLHGLHQTKTEFRLAFAHASLPNYPE